MAMRRLADWTSRLTLLSAIWEEDFAAPVIGLFRGYLVDRCYGFDLPPKTGPGVKLDMGWMSRTHPRTYRSNISAGTKIGVGHYSQTHPHT